MAHRPRNLDEVKRNIEQSLIDQTASDRREQSVEEHLRQPPEASLVLTEQVAGVGQQLVLACNTTADEMLDAGKTVVQIANGLAEEAQALSELLRKHGTSIAARIEHFAEVSHRLADSVKAARAVMRGGSSEESRRHRS
jgi:hypothetical protein